jgi:hypothetical protein
VKGSSSCYVRWVSLQLSKAWYLLYRREGKAWVDTTYNPSLVSIFWC